MFAKIHGLGFGPSITMLPGTTHSPLGEEDVAEPEQETREQTSEKQAKLFS